MYESSGFGPPAVPPLHFTPTSASWLNLLERWFAELRQKKLKCGGHRSVQALERDIRAWIADWNDHPGRLVCQEPQEERSFMSPSEGAKAFHVVGNALTTLSSRVWKSVFHGPRT